VNNKINGRIAAEWIWRFITVLLIPILLWLGVSINQLQVTVNSLNMRVVSIESNRFTAQDGAALWRELAERMDAIERESRDNNRGNE
jgi:hypothetical protein